MRTTESEIQSRLAAAAHARQRGAFEQERALLDQALAIDPADPQALNGRGLRALADGDCAKAGSLFKKAALADPGEPALWINLATAARAIGDAAGEREALDRVLAIDRYHLLGLLRKAELEERQGKAGDAAGCWNAFIQVATHQVDRPPMVDEAVARGLAFLASHTAALSSQLDSEFGRDRQSNPDLRRFNASMDHMLGRRAIYRNECHGLHYPFLPADEFFDKRLFPWLADVEQRTDAIRSEAVALLESPGDELRPYIRMEAGLPESKWSALDNSLDWGACFLWEDGEPNRPVLDRCPVTAAALEALPQSHIPGKAPAAFFSVLRPGARIPPHTGVTNIRTIVHLPLVVPDGCWFRVGGERREWVEGEAFAFDDTIEHEAMNPTAEPRIVLIFDVWNPHLADHERDALVRFYALQQRAGRG